MSDAGSRERIVLECRRLRKSFRRGSEEIVVLRGVDLTLRAGESVAVVGESGSGKSTLLYMLAGMDKVDAGEIKAPALSAKAGAHGGGCLGFIHQFHHLLPEFSAWENVAMPLRIAGQTDVKRRSLLWLQRVGLSDRADHRPGELSGGERQRVAIARALVTSPQCLLADEPTGDLDEHNAEAVFSLLLQLCTEERMGLILVTHNMRLAGRLGRTLSLRQGCLHGEDSTG